MKQLKGLRHHGRHRIRYGCRRRSLDEAPHPEIACACSFSYYVRALNFRDMAHPEAFRTYGRIFYRRAKLPEDACYPGKRGPSPRSLDALKSTRAVFAAQSSGAPHERQQWHRVQKCLRKLNADLKEAIALVRIDANLTRLCGLHTYATIARKAQWAWA